MNLSLLKNDMKNFSLLIDLLLKTTINYENAEKR